MAGSKIAIRAFDPASKRAKFSRFSRIADQKPVITEQEAVAAAGDGWPVARLNHFVGRVRRFVAQVGKQSVDFEWFEAGDANVEADLRQLFATVPRFQALAAGDPSQHSASLLSASAYARSSAGDRCDT